MITVSALAKDLHISVQAIYKKINKSMKNELHPYINTVNGQKVIDEQGADIIKNSFKPILNRLNPGLIGLENGSSKEQLKGVNLRNNEHFEDIELALNRFKPVQSAENYQIINILQNTLTTLEEQLTEKDLQAKAKDTQIENLQTELNIEREYSRDIANKLAELTRNSQVLLKNEQEKNILLLSAEQSIPLPSEPQEPKRPAADPPQTEMSEIKIKKLTKDNKRMLNRITELEKELKKRPAWQFWKK